VVGCRIDHEARPKWESLCLGQRQAAWREGVIVLLNTVGSQSWYSGKSSKFVLSKEASRGMDMFMWIRGRRLR
jgi:hypothetical protein